MPCVEGKFSVPDDEIKRLLRLLQSEPLSDDEIIARSDYPVFKARSLLRELTEQQLIQKQDDHTYKLTIQGTSFLSE